MWIKDYDGWSALKRQLDAKKSNTFYKERDVWWCSIGINIGSEQDGHNERYERPVLIVRGFSRELFLGIPLSSKPKHGPHYLVFVFEGSNYAALISQMRVLSTRRLIRKLYVMPQLEFSQMQMAIIREIIAAK